MDTDTADASKILADRLKQLPQVVQDAILSADVSKRLQELAGTHKLHLDQWDALENEVMLTLLGFQQTEELAANIKETLGTDEATSANLAADISKVIFVPIREALEKEVQELTGATNRAIAKQAEPEPEENPIRPQADVQDERITLPPIAPAAQVVQASAPAAPVIPATPPPAPVQGAAVRAPISESYKAGEVSTTRKSIHDDPYREPPK